MKRETQAQAGTQTDACEGWGQAASCPGAPDAGRGACHPREPSEGAGPVMDTVTSDGQPRTRRINLLCDPLTGVLCLGSRAK